MSIYNFCNFLYRFFFRSGGAVILLNGNHGSDPSLSVEVLKAQNMAQAIGNRDRTMARTECKVLATLTGEARCWHSEWFGPNHLNIYLPVGGYNSSMWGDGPTDFSMGVEPCQLVALRNTEHGC